jgi:hypothetical protein
VYPYSSRFTARDFAGSLKAERIACVALKRYCGNGLKEEEEDKERKKKHNRNLKLWNTLNFHAQNIIKQCAILSISSAYSVHILIILQ